MIQTLPAVAEKRNLILRVLGLGGLIWGLSLVSVLWGTPQAMAQPPNTLTFQVHPETTFQTMVGFGAGFKRAAQNFNAIQKPARPRAGV